MRQPRFIRQAAVYANTSKRIAYLEKAKDSLCAQWDAGNVRQMQLDSEIEDIEREIRRLEYKQGD